MAASMVVAYHFTTRYDESYIHQDSMSLALPKGFLGVNLFFAISGFVILMTLRRTESPIDFVVSRLSRLYPTFWAAVLISSAVVLVAGLPGHHPGPATIAGNLLMFHGLFLVPHVDGVYWSLEVELIFYVWMLALWCLGLLRSPLRAFAAWLMVSLASTVLLPLLSVRVPWTIGHLALLTWIPWFSLGVATYVSSRGESKRGAALLVVALAVTQIGLVAGSTEAAWAIAVAVVLRLAADGHAAPLAAKPIAMLGAISYPLYLIHENVGFAMMLRAERSGLQSTLAVGLAIVMAVALASILHVAVERPATLQIRAWYRRRQRAPVDRPAGPRMKLWGAGALSALVLVAVAMQVSNGLRHTQPLDPAAPQTASRRAVPAVDCTGATARADWWLLADDVPRIANSAVAPATDSLTATQALPCGTAGAGGGLATLLLEHSRHDTATLPGFLVSISPELHDARSPRDTRDDLVRFGAPPDAFVQTAESPTVILWQRTGWAVAQDLTADQYRDDLFDNVRRLREMGLTAPVYLARDALCRGDPFGVISRAQQRIPFTYEAMQLGILAGPDIDGTRQPGGPSSDCMLLAEERRRAVALWTLAVRNGGAAK